MVLHNRDNVATALTDIKGGTLVRVKAGDHTIELTVKQAIPFGHKFAIMNIEKGQPVYKYGEKIGKAIKPIRLGQHVHTHNVEGVRCRAGTSHRS